jgi:2-polyprenyl-6-methoxyphenol hydroxylase-like FAD-dependent oxidoreductase
MLLARQGHQVTLVERSRDLSRVFRGEALMPSGLSALREMGMLADLDSLDTRLLDGWEIYLNRQPIIRIKEPSAELGELALRVVSQPQLLERLVERASTAGDFRFLAPCSFRHLRYDEAGRVSGVAVAGEAYTGDLEASLVIGADGRGSLVRTRAGLELQLLDESYDILWFKVPTPEVLQHQCAIQIFAQGAEVALAYVSWDGSYQIAWMLGKGEWQHARKTDWLRRCTASFRPDLAEHILSVGHLATNPTLLNVMVGNSRSWWKPGLLLIGDAAHPMSPVRAQGINMALRDAIVVANQLRGCTSPAAVAGALEKIQASRNREIVRIQQLQYRELRAQRWMRRQPWLVKPMMALAPRLVSASRIERSWLQQQRPLRMGTESVVLD